MTDFQTEQAELAIYLANNPAMSARDFKGKGFTIYAPFDKDYVGFNEQPWHTLNRDYVREVATSDKARFLSKAVRQAAGRDAGLIFDERTRSYQRVVEGFPHPPEPKGNGV